jgi:AraC family transcriptional regulator of adaptative response/methylated-DNA-[protein]-cysteine methyltransferase
MSEHIRYAWGQSSLGEFIAARSEQGLVAFEFSDQRDETIKRLRARFPDAVVTEDHEALRDMIDILSDIVDHPEHRPDLALDVRGTDYQKRVWEILRQIPAGSRTNYGAIAAQLGTRDARDVTDAIASNAIAILIPCHRVVKKDGSLSGYRWGFKRKRVLLSREQQASDFKLG